MDRCVRTVVKTNPVTKNLMETTQDRLVLVTGAGKGIGRATAEALLATSGVRVIAVSRNLKDLASIHGDVERLELLPLDLLASDSTERLVEAVGDRRLHGLVHNAGLLSNTAMGHHQRADLERLYRTNVIVPLELSQGLAPRLAGDPPGHIVHIGSMGGFQDASKFPGLVAYSSSKAALACMAQCLAEEFKDQGIRSNCLALGAVDTDMLRGAFPGYVAQTSARAMGLYISEFTLNGHKLFNGKVLPVSASTP